MKTIFSFMLMLVWNCSLGQQPQDRIHLTRGKFITSVKKITPEMADHSLRIADWLFNSPEFRDSLSKLDFTYHNICLNCDSNTEDRPRLSGKSVLSKLLSTVPKPLTLKLKKVGAQPLFGHCFALGNTCPKTDSITSYYKNILCNMGSELPFEYAYAVHLCHEYMHNIGYCHTDHQDDVAECVGEIAFYFINNWYSNGIRIP